MVRDPCKGEEDEPQLRPIDVRFTCVVDCALCCAALRGRSSNEHYRPHFLCILILVACISLGNELTQEQITSMNI